MNKILIASGTLSLILCISFANWQSNNTKSYDPVEKIEREHQYLKGF